MTIRTLKLEDGKYEIDRDDRGLMVACRRNGEPWPVALEDLQFKGVVHAMLNRIEQLEDRAVMDADYISRTS